ncbi:AraC family transcriptional regulator [Leucobacter sp. wl10]|uniref:helix-turn-helix transcriptional regulator n=1 Tax=Leucobacter sp. wl10 TaxID=2304677 RepID=UPI001F09B78B|nr:AraC family transcriptional regulator [Leucobacter sp. wl10]
MSTTAAHAPRSAPSTPSGFRVPAATIDEVLAALDVEVRQQSRFRIGRGERIPLEVGRLSLVYGLGDEVVVTQGARAGGGGAEQYSERLSGGETSKNLNPEHTLSNGDVLLASGRRSLVLSAPRGAAIMLSILDLSPDAAHLADLLPEFALIRGFDRLEPAAAALTLHLGTEVDSRSRTREHCPSRDGDRVVCRVMARTVLLSAIRAWWHRGCAPEGWPSLSKDPFLDRVAAAVVADPGRDWSVGSLAAAGAMSRSVFAERFRAAFGSSPAGYVTEVRMRVAKDLLARGRSVSEVSRELGYRSDEGFSRAFRRSTGLTPSTWRSSARRSTAMLSA